MLSADRTESGIFIPEMARSRQQEVIVRAIGSGIKDGTEYQKGSRVFAEMYQGQVFKVKGEEFVFLARKNVIGIGVQQPDGSFQYHPIADWVMLRHIPRPQSVIQRPSAYEEDEGVDAHYEVHLVGLGKRNKKGDIIPFDVKVGDRVVMQSNLGRDVQAAEATYKLVKHDDILGIIHE